MDSEFLRLTDINPQSTSLYGTRNTAVQECPYINKLDSLLAYSERLQSKAKAREQAQRRGKTTTKIGDMQTVTDHRREVSEGGQ